MRSGERVCLESTSDVRFANPMQPKQQPKRGPTPPTLPPTDEQLVDAVHRMSRQDRNMRTSLAAVSAAAVSAAVTAALQAPSKARPKPKAQQETEPPMMRES